MDSSESVYRALLKRLEKEGVPAQGFKNEDLNALERREELAHQAEIGDLRPQVNPLSVLRESPENLRGVERVLLDRLFHFSRPIANAAETSGNTRISDVGQFFYLIETLRRAGSPVDDTLLVILDDFLELTERSYDELYLWSIVELSRRAPRNVEVLWPAAVALDQRFRFAAWERPPGSTLIDRPYRLCELVFYYYAVSILHLKRREPRLPSLGRCLRRIRELLTPEQVQLVGDTLRQMERDDWRAVYGDAFGMFMLRK